LTVIDALVAGSVKVASLVPVGSGATDGVGRAVVAEHQSGDDRRRGTESELTTPDDAASFRAHLTKGALQQQIAAFRRSVEHGLRRHLAEEGLHGTEFSELTRAVRAGCQVLVHGAHLLLVQCSENIGTEQLRVVLRGHPATPFSATC
jgi:hypothetical protein